MSKTNRSKHISEYAQTIEAGAKAINAVAHVSRFWQTFGEVRIVHAAGVKPIDGHMAARVIPGFIATHSIRDQAGLAVTIGRAGTL